jgi:hypothetical protein
MKTEVLGILEKVHPIKVDNKVIEITPLSYYDCFFIYNKIHSEDFSIDWFVSDFLKDKGVDINKIDIYKFFDIYMQYAMKWFFSESKIWKWGWEEIPLFSIFIQMVKWDVSKVIPFLKSHTAEQIQILKDAWIYNINMSTKEWQKNNMLKKLQSKEYDKEEYLKKVQEMREKRKNKT